VAAIDREFDYLVGPDQENEARLGSVVRVELSGRRVGGWVVDDDVSPSPGRALRTLAKVTGWGPAAEVIELAGWAAWRWAGRRASLLATASPDRATVRLPPAALGLPARPSELGPLETILDGQLDEGPTVLRAPPAADLTATVALVAQLGPTLVVVADTRRAAVLAERLRRAGAGVAAVPDDWAQARAGAAVVVGSRAAAWAPCPGLAAVMVIDGHDERLAQQQTPTWHAAVVAAERARRAGVPCVVTSPCPPLDLAGRPVLRLPPDRERAGWPLLEVVDRRRDDPRLGLFSSRVVEVVRGRSSVVCVVNRTGRARLSVCGSCGELARCERCGAALRELSGPVAADRRPAGRGDLSCPRCGAERPPLCAVCGSTAMRRLRIGVSRVREELEALSGRPVGEVTSAGAIKEDAALLVGTEAVLGRGQRADTVVFLDFDQELLAPRYRAGEEALALIARAGRLVGGRGGDGRGAVIVQTRLPDHPVLRAAVLGDPDRFAGPELGLRRELGLPPFAALAAVSGPGASTWVESLRATLPTDVGVQAAGDDRWMVRADDHTALCDALAAVDRPAARTRVEVDPQRV
jgi:primosomal protein N' (replication factor Y)